MRGMESRNARARSSLWLAFSTSLLLHAAVLFVGFSASDQPAVAVAPQAAETPLANPIDSALTGAWRSDANKARDSFRHPAETLAFFGVTPNQTVIEINPGGGWYNQFPADLQRCVVQDHRQLYTSVLFNGYPFLLYRFHAGNCGSFPVYQFALAFH